MVLFCRVFSQVWRVAVVLNFIDLKDRVFLISGATSGIGLSIVENLIASNARVVANARSQEKLVKLSQRFRKEQISVISGDCSDHRVTNAMANLALEKWGKIDGAIANAGTGFFGSLLDGTQEQIVETINTNYLGTINLARSVLAILKDAGQGDIVIIASAAGYRGNANEAVYAGTKHAQVGFAGSLDREVAKFGVRVSLICPAGTNTNFALGNGRSLGDPKLEEYLDPEFVSYQVLEVLKQPLNVRTQSWGSWSIHQDS